MRLSRAIIVIWFSLDLLLFCPISGSPENRTQRDSVISRVWATSPRLPFAFQCQSGWPESNRHDRAPKARGLATTQHPVVLFFVFSDPCGIRTQPIQLERLTTSPEVERAVVLCQRGTLSAVGREALESSSPGFQPSAIPSQLPTRHRTGSCGRTPHHRANKKSPMSL